MLHFAHHGPLVGENPMAGSYHQATEIESVGLNTESFESFSSEVANSLLRILQDDETMDERTYSSVTMFQVADGRNLYILPH
jgi:hypothetical protein